MIIREKNEAISSAISLAETKTKDIVKLNEQIEELNSKVLEIDELQEWKYKFEKLDADHDKISNSYDELMIKYDSLQEDVYKLEYCIKCKEDQNDDLQVINSTLKQEVVYFSDFKSLKKIVFINYTIIFLDHIFEITYKIV